MLSDQLSADLKQAMLNRDATTVSVLRMLQSELKNASIAKQGEVSDQDAIAIIRKEVKKRHEAATLYKQGNSTERAEAEEAEAAILSRYLPAAADEDTVRAFLKEKAAELGALEPRHKGELIKAAVAKFDGGVDGQTAARLVNELY
ncbi:MAG TPA: GatB/YqeY domain-containing protein [Verrucomicrobiae bacterium]|nr:GatB/YqeY domain-containing protein [Verrucomicrobiae bacterium]